VNVADRPLWERQPWDTAASFDRFHRFYLPQERPRSVVEAYRRYRQTTGKDPAKIRQAPGGWNNWAAGRDSKGQPIEGAKTWEQRAQAYDDHLAKLDRERWEARRRAVRERDWDAGEELRDLAAKVLAQAPQFVKTTRRLLRGHDGAPDREVITLGLDADALLKTLKLASELQRQAAEVPPPKQQHDVHLTNPIPIAFVRAKGGSKPDASRDATATD